MAEVAVVNASPLIFLASAELLDFLRLEVRRVVVPTAVISEIERRVSSDATVAAIRRCSWLLPDRRNTSRPECPLAPCRRADASSEAAPTNTTSWKTSGRSNSMPPTVRVEPLEPRILRQCRHRLHDRFQALP